MLPGAANLRPCGCHPATLGLTLAHKRCFLAISRPETGRFDRM